MRLAFYTLLASMAPTLAYAVDLPCPPAEPGTIELDGLADDWRDAQAATGGDAQAGVSLRCDTAGRTLYVEVEAADERVVRTAKASLGEDHVLLTLGKKHFTIFPASGSIKGKVAPAVKMASSASDKGFVIEMALPLAGLGLGGKPERVPFKLEFDDCDSAAALKTEHKALVEGELAFTSGPSTIDAFLQDRGLSRSVVKWQRDVRDHGKAFHLVLAGKILAALSDGYTYVELPVRDGTDVKDPQVVDFTGDGRPAVVLRYVERGEGGERDVLAAYRLAGTELKRIFAAEIGKRTEAGKLASKVSFKKHGRATDIVLEAEKPVGFTATTYNEAAATDVVPILLPWVSADKRATFAFAGDEYTRK